MAYWLIRPHQESFSRIFLGVHTPQDILAGVNQHRYTELSEEEIIRTYGKRWDIEAFFKSCKSYLKLVKECRNRSYDALNAHIAIVFTRYMMLSVAKRQNEDEKTMCELLFCLLDEMENTTFNQSMRIILEALIDTVMEYFHITETQLEELTASFISRLTKYMQNALREATIAA